MSENAGPREIFEQMQRHWLEPAGRFGDLLADDAIVETPFAPPGSPTRVEGREEWLRRTEPERANFPVRFEEVRNVVVHETADPEVIVVEYELAGVIPATGYRGSESFIGVLRVREGKVVHWREYQNTLAIAAVLGRLPDLAAAYGGS
ncbi:nuclear transport factor 2 family protein [Actinoallomurus sp. NBC_01490]|uniref:nuclear transport factor 2 family protein n=1 Tax=Actinoallomurus sp. NBC_01490 TaxID=2903557 RepID=UPI002E3754B4|nr:nuclear transport factor 2 family protein [Actinoallomurus sp. NBC_01490]